MNEFARHIASEIQRTGIMPFVEFMRRALYDPVHGYYSRPIQPIGKRGDFFTSVSVGPFFGELLAFQFARWIEELENAGRFQKKSAFQIVEGGAHNGQLAFDILDTLEKTEPKLFRSLEYWILEPSPVRRQAQQNALSRFAKVRWLDAPAVIPAQVNGVLFSNELLDAMPVHVFRWDASSRRWNEMGVGLCGGRFAWKPLPLRGVAPAALPDELLAILPDGYVIESSPAATQWWRDASNALSNGKLVTIDYGGDFEESLSSGRVGGTLRAYSQHHVGLDILDNPGEQDITAHVNFSEVRQAGEALGLKTEAFTTQSQFLTAIAREMWARTGLWPQPQVRQFQTLTHPEHLGRPFRVLVQSR